jgi:hypothetical protein
MSLKAKYAALTFGVLLVFATFTSAQTTVTRTNRRGDTVTDTRSLQNGQYTNDKTVTSPSGRTYTKDKTGYINANGRPVTQTTRTGPNGKSVTSQTYHGTYANTTRLTGPNGGTRVYRRPR